MRCPVSGRETHPEFLDEPVCFLVHHIAPGLGKLGEALVPPFRDTVDGGQSVPITRRGSGKLLQSLACTPQIPRHVLKVFTACGEDESIEDEVGQLFGDVICRDPA